METIKVNELVFHFELYPRNRIDQDHVQRLLDAIEGGAVLPPVIACSRTKRIVDGFHRTTAILRRQGGQGDIPCILKEYRNDREFFLDAVRYNAEHGLVLSAGDRARVIELGESLRIEASSVAGALHVSVAAARRLSVAPSISTEGAGPALTVARHHHKPQPAPAAEVRNTSSPTTDRPRYVPRPASPPQMPVESRSEAQGRYLKAFEEFQEWCEGHKLSFKWAAARAFADYMSKRNADGRHPDVGDDDSSLGLPRSLLG